MQPLRSPEVIVVGAGAVGLMLGNLLGQQNIPTLILEKSEKVPRGSRAIGITPPSLDLLASLGLGRKFLQQGVRVRQAVLHGKKAELGRIHFDCLSSAHPFILSLPQERAEQMLAQNLHQFPSVALRRGQEATAIRPDAAGASVEVRDVKTLRKKIHRARLICICDGKKSSLRPLLGLEFPGRRYAQTYLMADFKDKSGLGDEAHFFFTPRGPVESFPLPRGRRRWVVETETFLKKPEPGFIERVVLARTGFALSPGDKQWESPFGTQRHLAGHYFREGVLLCGDAAHVMSPIGGQGLNTGWGDAEFAARALACALAQPEQRGRVFRAYERYRKKAFRAAAGRAEQLMRLGTWKGRLRSAARNLVIRWAVGLLPRTVAGYFSMLSIPWRTLALVVAKESSLFKKNQFNESEKQNAG